MQGGIMSYSIHRLGVSGPLARISIVFFGFVLLAFAGSVSADFEVTPNRLNLSAKEPTGTLLVRNTGAHETIIELDIEGWTQVHGRDRFEPSTRLIVAQPVVRLRPGESQKVRVGLRLSGPRWKEESYRVQVRELPRIGDVGESERHGGRLTAVRSNSVPVFVQPPGQANPRLWWQLERTDRGEMRLRVSNRGDAHVHFRSVQLQGPGGQFIQGVGDSSYVLNGVDRAWELAADAPAGSRWLVVADTDRGPLEADLVVSAN